ncbi:Sh3 domain-containing ysc84-like protein [Thalictrum thalictroides]|uniref:Sh3 domain-containing ysc84-like protein n=1 Tax=Thalictrum thalictroides TaxID=46969 RepID=A0A7J6W8P5_THATH|nr:Sh3 domain-containing ysc84-like protein [Thalictrum thalictroides]
MEEENKDLYPKIHLDEFEDRLESKVSLLSFQHEEIFSQNSSSQSDSPGSLIKDGVPRVAVDPQGGKCSQVKECDIGVPQEGLGDQRCFDKGTQIEDGVPIVITDTHSGERIQLEECDPSIPQGSGSEDHESENLEDGQQKHGRYFYYESPLWEETGVWIPVSLPPMSESEHDEWNRGFCANGGGYFPDGDMGWSQYVGEGKELTMWDVVLEMLLAARGQVKAIASGDIQGCMISWASNHLLEQAWKDVAETLSQVSYGNVKEILETEPPKWLADSASSACMLCNVRFHPIMCSRHHCRYCGGIFCGECSKGRSLLPVKFRTGDPQRVCDVCCVRLESVQSCLMDQISRAAQLPTHDLTDLSTLRSWVNFPWGQSLEYEIYKAANTIKGYQKVGSLKPERSIPEAILKRAKGLAILTVAKVGVVVTYKIGTGVVIARREDGSWSPPSAISSLGVGWGAQAGGELTDFIIVLRTEDAVKTFSGNVHFSFGAGLSAAAGVIGRAVEADVRAGDGGYAACYTYSCSKGAFVGCSLEGSIVTTRTMENSRFYGSSSISSSDILLGSLPKPPAAAILYNALADLYQKL